MAEPSDFTTPITTQPTTTQPPVAVAGWYPTPDGALRYWDGAAWTEHQMATPAAPTAPQPQYRAQMQQQLAPQPHAPAPTPAQHLAPATGGYGLAPAGYGIAPVAHQPMVLGYASDKRDMSVQAVFAWVFTLLTLGYMLPWAIAASRGKSNSLAIGVLTFFLGWTFIGWIAAMVMACGTHQSAMTIR